MAPYRDFAYFYDELNSEADYDGLAAEILRILRHGGVSEGIVADLGCGTGEMTLRLAAAGYDMIAADASADMLQILLDKLADFPQRERIQPVCQPLQVLDLYGTIRAAVSTYDTFNHLPPPLLAQAMRRIALFLEPDGLLVFDVNTPYKHASVLANHVFELHTQNDVHCKWKNVLNPHDFSVSITLEIMQGGRRYTEQFTEYIHTRQALRGLLRENGLVIQHVCDGETFSEMNPQSQRMLIAAKKEQ